MVHCGLKRNRLLTIKQIFFIPFSLNVSRSSAATYTMPSEEDPHEATWLQWPHNKGWDFKHVKRYENSWIDMTRALHTGEHVYIIVYNRRQKKDVKNKLKDSGIKMSKISLFIFKTDDVWVRNDLHNSSRNNL